MYQLTQLADDRQRQRLAHVEQHAAAPSPVLARRAERPEPVFLMVTRLWPILSATH